MLITIDKVYISRKKSSVFNGQFTEAFSPPPPSLGLVVKRTIKNLEEEKRKKFSFFPLWINPCPLPTPLLVDYPQKKIIWNSHSHVPIKHYPSISSLIGE